MPSEDSSKAGASTSATPHHEPKTIRVDEKAIVDSQNSTTGLTPLTGWRWTGMAISLCLGVMLSVAEQSISATALVSIGVYFDDFLTTTWVMLSYLLGNIGFAIVFPRLSDVVGRKTSLLVAWVLFTTFSLGAGLSQSLTALIVCRGFQGIGGTGLYGMAMVIFPQITPIPRWGLMTSLTGVTFAVTSVIGPVLGGVITQESTWRWVYLFNAPFGVVGVLLVLLCWPKNHNGTRGTEPWNSIDVVGALLLMASSCLLIFALQEAGTTAFAWDSKTIIASLVVAGVCCVAFVTWIVTLSFSKLGSIKPIFPLSIAISKPSGAGMVVALCAGFPQLVPVVTLAERFQIVNAQIPILAGARLMPLLSFAALGAALSGGLTSKKNRTSELAIAGCCFAVLGSGLLSTLSTGPSIEGKQYGYQVLLGIGVGMVLTALTLMLNLANSFDKIAAAQGAINQLRQLGGSIGLAVFTIILNQKFDTRLGGQLDAAQLSNLKQSLSTIGILPTEQRALIGTVFAEAFNETMRVCMYLSIGALLAAIGTYSKHPASVAEAQKKQHAMVQQSELPQEGSAGLSQPV